MKYEYYGLFDPRNDIIMQNLYDYDWGKQMAYALSSFSMFGINPVQMYDNARRTADYMRNRQIGWDDVLYPSKLYNSGTGVALSRGINFVSDNIKHLYD